MDAARLDAVRKHLRYSIALRMQSSDAIAGILAQFIALRRTPESMNKLYDQYASLTPDDVQKAAASIPGRDSGRTIVTLTGRREARDEAALSGASSSAGRGRTGPDPRGRFAEQVAAGDVPDRVYGRRGGGSRQPAGPRDASRR